MNKLLIYHNSEQDAAMVLQAFGDQVENIQTDLGSNWSDWPEDLGIYDRPSGLVVWEGEIDLDDNFKGELRDLNSQEKDNLLHQGKAWL